MSLRLFEDDEKVTVWILSEFGKPIFSSCGREDELCGVFALIQVFVKRYEAWKDTLVSIQAPPHFFVQFSHRAPLILCIVSRHPYNLRLQLDIVHNQVVSILSKTAIKGIYEKYGDNFDLRRYLDGIHKRVDACIKGFNEDPVVFLSGFRVLPLNPADREFLCSTMASIITEHSRDVVFGILVVHRQLVAIARMRKVVLSPSDFNDIIVNMIECHSGQQLREGETWVPICLPQFNQNSFLYAHISYLWEGAGPCLLLLSVSRDSFDALREVRKKIEEAMLKRYAQLKASLSHPEPFSFRQVNTNDLRHFIYRNTLTSQVCCSTPQIPYINHSEVLSLYEGYFKLSNMLRRGKNVKMLFLAMENFSLFSWITASFELHCTFSPLVSQASAMSTAERMLRVLRKEEKRVFFDTSSGLLA